MNTTRLFLESIGMPKGDLYSLPTEADARKCTKLVALVKRVIDEYFPESIASPKY